MSKGIDREIKPIDALEIAQKTGELSAAGFRFAIVVARFNDTLTDALAQSAVGALQACGASAEAIELFRVPGAYEIPVTVERVLEDPSIDAVIALGVVVEGETQHAQMIIETTGQSLLDQSIKHKRPIINEIVGARTWEQAEVRCLREQDSRGWYAGLAAVEMVQLLRRIG